VRLPRRPHDVEIATLLASKAHGEPSVFTASNLLREARRQRGLSERRVPPVCILDPDGDLARYVHETAGGQTAGVLGVEMEAAALYAFAEAGGHSVLCLAHLTNALGGEGDFEKGASDGAEDALRVVEAVVRRLT
jgi:hypothetical protein